MDYPNVKNAHIVPRVYLANFAHDGKIGTHLVNDRGRYLILPIEGVGTRRRYYRRKRPDGSLIDDIEWSLSKGESASAPVLQAFDADWPLPLEDRAKLAELFAYQLLRGPRWESEHTRSVDESIDEYRNLERLKSEDEEKARELLGGDTHRFIQMLRIGPTAASILGSMHWTLLRFESPVVVTSDHPVVPWPGAGPRSPQATEVLRHGLLECVEVRLPLSPTRAVLMTWADKVDDEDTLVDAKPHHAGNLNAFTVASADAQWFSLPGTSPPIGSGSFLPLSTQLITGYTASTAAGSSRRRRTLAEARAKVGRQLSDRDMTLVTMTRPEG